MRMRTWFTLCLAFLVVAVPTVLFGQDTIPTDSIPPQPPAAGSGLCGFLDPYQMPVVQALSAGLLWVFAQISPAFANAGDWVKRFAAFLAGTAIAFIVAKLGCTPNAELSTGAAAALSGFIAALVNWLMFRIVKTQPSGATA